MKKATRESDIQDSSGMFTLYTRDYFNGRVYVPVPT